MSKEIFTIRNKEITKVFEETTRQYLVGNLGRPQELNHFQDDKLEIGITSYKEPNCEAPHYHTQAYEYQYIISGETEYIDIESGKEYSFYAGDFYVTPPGIKYAQRSKPGTTIFFIKSPPGDDKVVIEPSKELKTWMKKVNES